MYCKCLNPTHRVANKLVSLSLSNANHPIERNYGNSVRFLAKIPNGTAAKSPCYSVFWNAIDFCRLYTSKKISMWALPTVPLFAGKSRFFTRNVPLKTFSRLAGLCFLWGSSRHHFVAILVPYICRRPQCDPKCLPGRMLCWKCYN